VCWACSDPSCLRLQQCVGEPPPAGRVRQLTQGEFEAERTGFFPSLQATLNHIYVIDLWGERMSRKFIVAAIGGNGLPDVASSALRFGEVLSDRAILLTGGAPDGPRADV
jgi:hypothetical protein